MEGVLANLAVGFAHVFEPVNLLVLVVGIVLGLLVAVLPGLTLVMGVVLALPFTYSMDVTAAIILLTAMYVSGTYAGAWTSILFHVPGEPIDVPLLWDGYAMARKGKAAEALGWTLIAAFFGGMVAAVVMVLLSQPIARVALTFSTPEYFAIIFFGLASVVSLGGGSLANALISLFAGLLIATVGVDDTYGAYRFTFNIPILSDGIDYLVVMVGAYGLGEVFVRLEQGFTSAQLEAIGRISTKLPGLREILAVKSTFLRSGLAGILIGIVPGAGATVASFLSYGMEGQYGRRRAQMGSGIAEGIVAPQTAATASVGGAIIPLVTLGIPGSGATAIILGAFLLHGLQPGPQVFQTSANIVYAMFASVFAGIVVMCVIGYFATKPMVKVLDLPEVIVSAYVVMLCLLGAFAARNNITDVWLMVIFGILGYLFERFRFPITPLVLGVILGPLAETNFMTTMISFNNDWTVFFTRPLAGPIMLVGILTLLYPLFRHLRRQAKMRGSRDIAL
ncbi:MAG: tripartite tricarboxylate transporter permease [Betaproteobacteria bacterium]|nr:tripartite tricarboxylate transporter permease [Betaproteobacteria bacterium]MBI3937034.1 tripartite tricarboxylate transporter permease [Betaproteobacteria bacterium]